MADFRHYVGLFLQPFFQVTVPKVVVIKNKRFGLISFSLQAATMAFLLYQMFSRHEYERVHPAVGRLETSWLDRSGIAAEMSLAEAKPYCAQPYAFNYQFCNHSSASEMYNEFWREDNIACDFIDPAFTMVKQTPYDIWIFSYVKRRSTRQAACSTGASACAAGLLRRAGQRAGEAEVVLIVEVGVLTLRVPTEYGAHVDRRLRRPIAVAERAGVDDAHIELHAGDAQAGVASERMAAVVLNLDDAGVGHVE